MTPTRKRAASSTFIISGGDTSGSDVDEEQVFHRLRRRTSRPQRAIELTSSLRSILPSADRILIGSGEDSDSEGDYALYEDGSQELDSTEIETTPSEEENAVISVGSEEEFATSDRDGPWINDEDEHVEFIHDDQETTTDDPDARYARLLQQQEIALLQTQMLGDALRGLENRVAEEDDNQRGNLNPLARGMVARAMAMARHMQQLMRMGLEDEEEDGADDIDMSYESLIELQENLGEVKRRGLEEHSLKSLLRIKFSVSREKEECKDNDRHTCVVCMTEFADGDVLVRLECKHHFHEQCATGWLRVRASCPICREMVPDAPSVIDLR